MRVFKPLQLSLQTKPFLWDGNHELCVSVLLAFPFDAGAQTLLEQDFWALATEQLGKEAVFDLCMPKPQGEVLVHGSCFARDGAVAASSVRLTCGAVDKRLAIFGDRYWSAATGPGKPAPFTEMPVDYVHAFGGEGHAPNPAGKGMQPVDTGGEMRTPLPNVEDPAHPLTSLDQRPEPAGLAPLDVTWAQRASRIGTYDESWLEKHFPGYAPDLDWNHFNAAPSDQWIEAFWRGDEPFAVHNMHPEKESVGGRLPGFRVRCFVERHAPGDELDLVEVGMRADTVVLLPAVETGVLIYRGTVPIAEDDAADVAHLLCAYEHLESEPRSRDYYGEALHNRLDEAKLFRYLMSTKDIIPERERCGFARLLDTPESSGESELAKNLAARAQAEKDKALAMVEEQKQTLGTRLEAAGIDPAPHLDALDLQADDDPDIRRIKELLERLLPGSTSTGGKVRVDEADFGVLEELEKAIREVAGRKQDEIKQQLDESIARVAGTPAEAQTREQVAAAIARLDAPPPLPRPPHGAVEQMRAQLAGLQRARATAEQAGIPTTGWPDPAGLEARISAAGEQMVQLKATYRSGAQFVDGTPPHEEPLEVVQVRFDRALAEGRSVAGWDLAGVDATGRDLNGIDLSDCYLEYTDFTAASLRGANLRRAIFTHAKLERADLTDADLVEANLGASDLEGAVLDNANLRNGVLSRARLRGARLRGTDLCDVEFLELEGAGADFGGARFSGASFLERDLRGASFANAVLPESSFVQCNLDGTDFSGTEIGASNFIECSADDANFAGAQMSNTRFVAGCSLRNARFDGAVLDRSNFRDSVAEGCTFERSSFHMADFSGANLKNAKFYGAAGKRALFMGTDLAGADLGSVNVMEGSLLKAHLTGASLAHANCYGVEFLNVTVGGTDFSGANLDLTKLQDWHPSDSDG